MFFVQRSQIPTGRKISYGNFIYDVRPQKPEIHRVRLTAGGDKLDAYKETSSPTVSLIDAKLNFNSTISDDHNSALHLGLDINNFYLGTLWITANFNTYGSTSTISLQNSSNNMMSVLINLDTSTWKSDAICMG